MNLAPHVGAVMRWPVILTAMLTASHVGITNMQTVNNNPPSPTS